MRVLALLHEEHADAGVFAEAVAEGGDSLSDWNIASGSAPPESPDTYDAVLVFGGVMHVDQEESHPWLRDESLLIQRLLEKRVPVLGVCLGAQLLAAASDAPVTRASRPEIGWYQVELTPEAADDPIFRWLPERFTAFQWHSYEFGLPAGAVPLARTPVSLQAYRLGEAVWGLQFHAEVTKESLEQWIANYRKDEAAVRMGFDPARARAETQRHIGQWNNLGKEICRRFLAFVESAKAE